MTGISVVTGGAGFVGRHLVRLLRARGERVRSFDLAPPVHADDVQGSILDGPALARAMDGAATVFHLAGNAQLWARDPSVFDKVNHIGTRNVVDAARRASVSRFVHCSSLTTLVSANAPIGASSANEETLCSAVDMLGPYPLSKLRAELAVRAAADDGFNAVIAIPTEPLGAGDDALTPPTRMILDFANGKTPAYIDCVLNFVAVESLAEGLIAARDQGVRGQRYVLGGENTTLRELLDLIEARTGRAAPKLKMPYWVALAAGAVDTGVAAVLTGKPPKAPLTGVRLAGRQVSFSSEKAARVLGWRSSPMAPALDAMLEWAKDKGLLM